MASNTFFSDEAAEAGCDAVAAKCNGGFIKVYDGDQPDDSNTAITDQVLLGTFDFASTAFGASAATGTAPDRAAVATAAAIADVDAVASGTASWFRAYKSNGTSAVYDGSVGTSGCDLNLTDISITAGEAMSIASLTLANPE